MTYVSRIVPGTRPFTVAIDGPAAAGKGTISRAIAKAFSLGYLDTGLLYRATGARSLAGEDPIYAATDLREADLARTDLRTQAIAEEASRVSAIPEVRAALKAFQKRFARRPGGAVLDGRDIGTVICPNAEVKFFVTASPEVRAARRHAELIAAGQAADFDTVLAEIKARDARDSGRANAPLAAAPDAILIDTSAISIAQAVTQAGGAVLAGLKKAAQ